MNLYNPTTAPPKWSLQQRKMFEAIIVEYCIKVLKKKEMSSKVRNNIKKEFGVSSTYELSQMEFEKILNRFNKLIN